MKESTGHLFTGLLSGCLTAILVYSPQTNWPILRSVAIGWNACTAIYQLGLAIAMRVGAR